MDDRDQNGKFIQGNQASKGKGRTKESISIKDTLRQYLDKKVKDIDPALVAQIAGKDKAFAKKYGDKKLHEALAIAYIREGLKGDFRLLEQMEGKPAQNVNVGGQENNPVKIQFEYIDPNKDEE